MKGHARPLPQAHPTGLTMAGTAWDIVAMTPYIYTGYTWLNPFGYGFPVAYGGLPYAGQDDAGGGPQPGPQQADYVDQPPADYSPEPPAPQVADNAPPTFRPPYQGQAVDAPVNPQPATTLIFKDGRPP